MVAEQIEKPASIPPEEFAAKLVEAEGLTSWSPQDPTSSSPGERLPYKARHAANGREVVVYFSPSPRLCAKSVVNGVACLISIRRQFDGALPRWVSRFLASDRQR